MPVTAPSPPTPRRPIYTTADACAQGGRGACAALGRWLAPVFVSLALACTTTSLPPAGRPSVGPPRGATTAYAHGIRPNVSQAEQDRALLAYYEIWKARYVRRGACPPGRAYIDSSLDAGEPGSITVSEAHGFGMLTFALMAFVDPEARALFDGMVRFLGDHPSTLRSGLMAWDVHAPCDTPAQSTSAPDGDLDIAYALLLADHLWGSSGPLDYRRLAAAHMAALLASEAVPAHGYFTLWEYIAPGEPHAQQTRTSDTMFGHFRAFARASGDPAWSTMCERAFSLLHRLAEKSPLGFFPDFARDVEVAPVPAAHVFRTDGRDGTYSYNACRLPMRWAVDVLGHGDPRSRHLVGRLVEAIRAAAGGDPRRVMDGYGLAGEVLGERNRLAFVAPLAVGAMASPEHQPFLDALWQHLVDAPLETEGYYGNALKMLALIVLSGHWVEP